MSLSYIDQILPLLGDRKLLTNQVELHPFLANEPIVNHTLAHGIGLTAYSPLARGAVLGDPVLKDIGAAHDASEGQIALAWLLAKGYWVIPSSGNPGRIKENYAAGDITLSAEQIARIDGIDRGMRLVDGPWCPVWDT